eukprot:GILI01014470.1.p1 GENE.GILI01014470.1~~GILI01014470.1.p1  ORF type:complete len:120 (-),score=28.31 GILI01014470.1:131-490(-)
MGAAACAANNDTKDTSTVAPSAGRQDRMAEEKTKMDPKNLPLYTKEEVAKHNTVEDFWVIIMNKVYHLPAYVVEAHSGGDIILDAAGKDATHTFEDGPHGEYAREELASHLIGKIAPTN